jgi:hypothetical protein
MVQWLSPSREINGFCLQSRSGFNVNSLLFKHRCEAGGRKRILHEYNGARFVVTGASSRGGSSSDLLRKGF